MSIFGTTSLSLLILLLATLFETLIWRCWHLCPLQRPYLPTACYGNSSSQFPSSNLFAAAGEGIWDNGAACGRQYLVRCISAAVPRTCLPDQMVQVRIVDRAQTSRSEPSSDGVTIVLATPRIWHHRRPFSTIN
ncbi:hypothetical protein NC652_017847 [Populus alba x Populus x berolinensis]|nr:hypothetical protein NC652_017847 [Populus alba x Populus x berolinensis]